MSLVGFAAAEVLREENIGLGARVIGYRNRSVA